MTNDEFLQLLPEGCRPTIAPRHKMILVHYPLPDSTVWVVLLTTMPGDSSKAWHMNKGDYWRIQPKHEYRDRWIRENLPPTLEADRNPEKPRPPRQLPLIFL